MFIGATDNHYIFRCTNDICALPVFDDALTRCDHGSSRNKYCRRNHGSLTDIFQDGSFRFQQLALVARRNEEESDADDNWTPTTNEEMVARLFDTKKNRYHAFIEIADHTYCDELVSRGVHAGCLHFYEQPLLKYLPGCGTFHSCGEGCDIAFHRTIQDSRMSIDIKQEKYLQFAMRRPVTIELEPVTHTYYKLYDGKAKKIECLSVTGALHSEHIGFPHITAFNLSFAICVSNPHIAKHIFSPEVLASEEYKRASKIVLFDEACSRSSYGNSVFVIQDKETNDKLLAKIFQYCKDWCHSALAGTIAHHMIEGTINGSVSVSDKFTEDDFYIDRDGIFDHHALLTHVLPDGFPAGTDEVELANEIRKMVLKCGNAYYQTFVRCIWPFINRRNTTIIPEAVLSLPIPTEDSIDFTDLFELITGLVGSADGIITQKEGDYFLINTKTRKFIAVGDYKVIKRFNPNSQQKVQLVEVEDDFGIKIMAFQVFGTLLIDWKTISNWATLNSVNDLLKGKKAKEILGLKNPGVVTTLSTDTFQAEIKDTKLEKYEAQAVLYTTKVDAMFRDGEITPIIIVLGMEEAAVFLVDKNKSDAWAERFVRTLDVFGPVKS